MKLYFKLLQTDKLIEVILECQTSSFVSEDAAAVVAALTDAFPEEKEVDTVKPNEEKRKQEELLSDIHFPDSLSLDEEEEPQKVQYENSFSYSKYCSYVLYVSSSYNKVRFSTCSYI